MKEEQRVDGEPPRKRLKRATAPSSSSSSSPTVGRGSTVVIEADEGGDRVEHTSSRSQGSLRRSTRVTRASAGAATAEAVVPARRGQATKGKKAKRQ
jgi:hypothetical protein